MFAGITGFFGKVFGTDKALQSVVSSVSNGLDKLVYTSEEKADAAAKDRTEARRMIIEWMAATQGQNLARRVLAFSITIVWLGQYVTSQILGVASIAATYFQGPVKPGAMPPAELLQKCSEFLNNGATDMNSAVMLILSFYFAAPYMQGAVSAYISKSANKDQSEGQ